MSKRAATTTLEHLVESSLPPKKPRLVDSTGSSSSSNDDSEEDEWIVVTRPKYSCVCIDCYGNCGAKVPSSEAICYDCSTSSWESPFPHCPLDKMARLSNLIYKHKLAKWPTAYVDTDYLAVDHDSENSSLVTSKVLERRRAITKLHLANIEREIKWLQNSSNWLLKEK